MTQTRNILIIGRTRNGKSSLVNTLVNKGEKFEEIFKESDLSVSSTKNSQKEIFRWDEIDYCVVDTIGLGDTKLSNKEVLYNIAETIGMMKEGISHILLVIKDTFSPEEKKNFKLLKEVMFESQIVPYTTIIRTNFESFRSGRKCESDRESLLNESEDIAEIIRSCNGFIHVNNPTLTIADIDSDSEEDEKKEEEITHRKKLKEKSRKKVLNYLKDHYQGNYKLKAWDKIYLRINNYLGKKNKDEDQLVLEQEKETVIAEVVVVLQPRGPNGN